MMTPAPYHAALAEGPEAGRARWLHAEDGVRIRLVLWPEAPLGRVLILPGRGEYGEKYGRVAADLARKGYGAAAVDWRGQGLSDRLIPDPHAGYVRDFSHYQRDLRAVLDALDEEGQLPELLIAHSMGGCIALRALLNGMAMRAVAFSAPMWGIQMSARALPAAWGLSSVSGIGRFSHRYVPGSGPRGALHDNRFEGNTLTSNPETFAWLASHLAAAPELSIGGPTLAWLNAALREIAALSIRSAPEVPAYVALGGEEHIVSPRAIRRRVARWACAHLAEFPEARHEIMMERATVRNQFLDEVTGFFAGTLRS